MTEKDTTVRRGRGRPRGSKTKTKENVAIVATRCPACGCTDRSMYHHRTEQEFSGLAPDGHPYTHIVRRRCWCLSCGQHRIDRTYENRRDNK